MQITSLRQRSCNRCRRLEFSPPAADAADAATAAHAFSLLFGERQNLITPSDLHSFKKKKKSIVFEPRGRINHDPYENVKKRQW